MPGSDRAQAFFLLFAGMAIFGSGTPISKIVTDAFPVFVASGARMLLAVLALAPVVWWVSRREGGTASVLGLDGIDRGDWLRLGGIAVGGMFLFSIFMLYGMAEISGALGGIVMSTTPGVTAAGAVLFLREDLDRWRAIAIGAAVGGVLAVNLGGTDSGSTGNVLLGTSLIFGAVCGEAAYTLLGKRLSADLDPIRIATITAALASVLFLGPALAEIGQLETAQIEATDWLALAWWGLGTMALGSVLWYEGVKRVPGTTASAFMGVMPVSAVVLSYILLGESFEILHAVGMAIVLGGVFAATRSDAG